MGQDKRRGVLAKDNYSYQKKQKELAKKKKREEKQQRKQDRKNQQAQVGSEVVSNGGVAATKETLDFPQKTTTMVNLGI